LRALQTPLCTLEPQVGEHAAEMFRVLADPAIYEFENEPPQSEAWLAERYRRLESRRSADGREQWLNWVVRLPSRELAGYVQATVRPSGEALIAYELNSRHWRRGIGRSAVQAMLDELRAQYGVRRFVAVLKARNFRSEGLLRRLGFEPADEAEAARHRDEADERVMSRAAAPT
jgi:[ribosomal protein S5]-alanine N-acetyltransferase